MSKEFENFKKKEEITKTADNTKMFVMMILVVSVIIFQIIGKENVKSIIWYWATFMFILLLICVIQDIQNKIKIGRINHAD